MGFCWHGPISSQPSWQQQGYAKLLHAWHPTGPQCSTCTGDLQKYQVSKPVAIKVVWNDKDCWPRPRISNLSLALESKAVCLAWGKKGKFTSKRLAYFGPSHFSPFGERAQKHVSPPFPHQCSLLLTSACLSPCSCTGWSPWPAWICTSQVQPHLSGHAALAGKTSTPVWAPSKLQMQVESC